MHNAWLRSLLCWKHPWVHFPLSHRLVKVKVKSLSRVRLFATPWTVAYQTPPSMGFSRQEYWSGLPFPSPGDHPGPGIEPGSPALEADTLTSEPPGCKWLLFLAQQVVPYPVSFTQRAFPLFACPKSHAWVPGYPKNSYWDTKCTWKFAWVCNFPLPSK